MTGGDSFGESAGQLPDRLEYVSCCMMEERDMDIMSKAKELLEKITSDSEIKDAEEILARGKEMGYDDLTIEDIHAAMGLPDEILDQVSGGMTVMS